jgi:RNA polymerase subunit RPABC4/transcription elongation factor Spt4
MIDRLPLDMFGEEPASSDDAVEAPSALAGPVVAAADPEPVAVSTEVPAGTRMCQWCGEHVAHDTVACPACGGRLAPVDERAAALYGTGELPPNPDVCQWCASRIDPADEFCPVCGGVARGDTTQVIPGVTVPLPESMIRSQVEREMARDDAVDGGDVAEAIVSVVLDFLG